MLLSRHQNVGQIYDIKIANRYFENVAQFRYLGTTIINQNLIQEEIKRRSNLGNACYHSVQNLLSSRLLSKSIKIRVYKTIILPVVLYGCKASSLTLKVEHILRHLRTRAWGEYFYRREMKWWELGDNWIFIICTLRQIPLNDLVKRMRLTGHVARRGEKKNEYRTVTGKARGIETTRKTKA
jgi:hypothetical protein